MKKKLRETSFREREKKTKIPAGSHLIIREFQANDIEFASFCTQSVGWKSETQEVLTSYFLYDSQGCFLAEHKGRRIGICIGIYFGRQGFVGELVVLPEGRGLNAGPLLFKRAVSYLHSLGVKSIFLDGVRLAVPFYESLGFKKVCPSLRFLGKVEPDLPANVRKMQAVDLPEIYQLDRKAFGADRSFFLFRRFKSSPELSWVKTDPGGGIKGFIMGLRGEGIIAAGPWVSRLKGSPDASLVRALASEAGSFPIRIGVPEKNRAAVDMIRSFPGFKEQQECWRMVLGKNTGLGISAGILAIASGAMG